MTNFSYSYNALLLQTSTLISIYIIKLRYHLSDFLCVFLPLYFLTCSSFLFPSLLTNSLQLSLNLTRYSFIPYIYLLEGFHNTHEIWM